MSDELEDLRKQVEILRLRAEIKKLEAEAAGPKEETKEEMFARLNAVRQREHDIMFAHSGTKPRLRLAKP